MGFIYDPIKGVLKQWTYVSIVDTNNRTFYADSLAISSHS